MGTLSAISDNIVAFALSNIVEASIVGLALAASGAKVAFLGFATAAHTGRIVRIINGAQVTADFAAAAGDAGLVDTLVLSRDG